MIANQLPNAFTNASKVTKSHILAANTLALVIVPKEHSNQISSNKSSIVHQKCGRPLGSKDTIPKKWKVKYQDPIENNVRAMNNTIFSKLSTL